MKKFLFRPSTIPAAFFLLCLLAYGLLIPWLGFYWDDWPYTWFSHTLGPLGLMKALAEDRPFLAVSYMIFTSIFGKSPLAWQLFAIFTRWLSVLAFWWTGRKVWPQHLRPVTWAAVLFAVYPGFLQHWISVIYSQAFLLMAAFIFSLGLMIAAVRSTSRRRYWLLTAIALLLSAFTFFSTEYFFGVELIRPVLIWIVLAESIRAIRPKLLPTLRHWAPYLVELVIFGVWRAFLFTASTYEVEALNELSTSLTGTLWSLIQTLIGNSFTAGWSAWNQALGAPNIWDLTIRTTQIYWVVVLITLALVLAYLFRLRLPEGQETASPEGSRNRWAIQAMLTGALILAFSSLPFWAAGLPLNLLFPFNRFTLAMMMGSCLLLVGILEFFIRTRPQKIVILALLVSFAVGYQFQTANTFRREWDSLRSFFWQLTWRMPGLKPGTMLLTHEFPFKYYSDNSLSAPLNWIYAPDNHTQDMPYILNYLKVRVKNTLPPLKPDQPVKQHYRAMTFYGNTSQSISLIYAPPGCLRVLDPVFTSAETFPDLQYLLTQSIPLSNLDQIITGANPPTTPPEDLFGPENTNTWCYYFQKAELARQSGDWESVANLGREAEQNKLGPNDPSEWLTLVEGYAHTGQWDKASSLTATVYENKPDSTPAICDTWERLLQTAHPGADEQHWINEAREKYQCAALRSSP